MPQTYATIDADGRATGFYVEGINPEIPAGAVPIKDAVYEEWVANTPTRRWTGKKLAPCDYPTPPPAARQCTPREFRHRFTLQERGALTLAASQAMEGGDPTLQVFLDDLSASQVVELDHPDLMAGMDALVAGGLLTRERADAILAG